MKNVINIAMICDNGYVMPTSVAIQSMISNRADSDHLIIHIIGDKLTDDNKSKLASQACKDVDLKFIETDSSRYSGLEKSYSKVSKASLIKFSIPELIPDVDKAIYIDGDVIVLKSLEPLYSIEIGDKYAVVVSDGPKKNVPGGKRHAYYGDPEYFNSGMMVLNLRKMRSENLSQKLIDFRLNEYNYFMDQDAFNRIFGENVIHVGVEYDFMLHLISYRNPGYSIRQLVEFYNISNYNSIDKLFRNVVILHYTFEKPWKYFDIPFNEIWMEHFYNSPFKETELNRSSFTTTQIFDTKTYTFSRILSKIVRKILFI